MALAVHRREEEQTATARLSFSSDKPGYGAL